MQTGDVPSDNADAGEAVIPRPLSRHAASVVMAAGSGSSPSHGMGAHLGAASVSIHPPRRSFMLTIFAALTQQERDQIVKRTTDGRAARGRKDEEKGGPSRRAVRGSVEHARGAEERTCLSGRTTRRECAALAHPARPDHSLRCPHRTPPDSPDRGPRSAACGQGMKRRT